MFSNIMSAIRDRSNRSREVSPGNTEDCGQGGSVEHVEHAETHEDMSLYESDAAMPVDDEDDSACDLSQSAEHASRSSTDLSCVEGEGTWFMTQCGSLL